MYAETKISALRVLAIVAFCLTTGCGVYGREGDEPPSPERIAEALRNASEVRLHSWELHGPPPLAISDAKVIAELAKRFRFRRQWGKPTRGLAGDPLNEMHLLVEGRVVLTLWIRLAYDKDDSNIMYRAPDGTWESRSLVDNAFYEYLSALAPEDGQAVREFYDAVQKGNTEAVASLLGQGCGPGYAMAEELGIWVRTPAQWALVSGQTDMARYLVTGAGFEDVHALAALGEVGRLQRILDQKPWAVNAVDWQGKTPLLYAIPAGQVAAVKFLVEHGADPNPVDESGKSALDRALAGGHHDIAELLRERGALPGDQLTRAKRGQDDSAGPVEGR